MSRSKIKQGAIPLIVLVLVFILNLLSLSGFSDISNHWAKDAILKWTSYNVIQNSDGPFRPDDAITRGEFAVILDRVFGFQTMSAAAFVDVESGKYYTDAVSKVAAAGVMQGSGNGLFRPEDSITRQEAAAVLARAFLLTPSNANAISKFTDSASVAAWAKNECSALVERNYLTGKPGNKLDPTASISRAETISIIDRIISIYINKPGISVSAFVTGNVLIRTDGASLKGCSVQGNVYISQGVASGTALLEGVVVSDNTYILGGGESGITIKDSRLSNITVLKYDDRVKIIASGNCEINNLDLKSGAILEEKSLTGIGFKSAVILDKDAVTLQGVFENILVNAPGALVKLNTGSIVNSITAAAQSINSTIEILPSALVETITANCTVDIKGNGRISKLYSNANITCAFNPDTLYVKSGMYVNINGLNIGEMHVTVYSTTGSSHAPVNTDKARFIFDISTMGNSILNQSGIFGYSSATTLTIAEMASSLIRLENIDVTLKGLESILPVDLLSGGDIFLRSAIENGIAVKSLYELFGSKITIKGSLSGTPVELELNFVNGAVNSSYVIADMYRQNNDYVIVSRILQSSMKITDIGIINILSGLLGSVPAKINVGNVSVTAPYDNNDIILLTNEIGATTLGDLILKYPKNGSKSIQLYKNAGDIYPVYRIQFTN